MKLGGVVGPVVARQAWRLLPAVVPAHRHVSGRRLPNPALQRTGLRPAAERDIVMPIVR